MSVGVCVRGTGSTPHIVQAYLRSRDSGSTETEPGGCLAFNMSTVLFSGY